MIPVPRWSVETRSNGAPAPATSARRLRRRLAAGAALALCALTVASAFAPAAEAQTAEDLLRKLKPWIKQQLLGEQPPADATPTPEAPDAAPPGSDVAAAPDAPADDGTAGVVEPPPPEEGDGAGDLAGPPAPDTLGAIPAEAPTEPPMEPVDQGPQPLRFAVLAGRSASRTIATVGPVADEMGAAVGRPVELLAMASYGAMVDAQVERRVDGGFYSASAFALADMRCHCLEPIVAPRAADGTLAYQAIIVARADSGIASAIDLEGKTVAVGAADSVGARRMQLAGLMASGIDPASYLGGVVDVGSASDAVRMVLAGRADAAFAWSSLAGDAASGYSRGTLTQLVADGELSMSDIVIVWRSPPITHGPFAVLSSLGADERDKIGAFLLALEATRPDAYDALNPFYGGGYAPVDAADYSGLETLTAQNVDALHLPMAQASTPTPDTAQPQPQVQ